MNKETILDCFYKDRHPLAPLLSLCQKHPSVLCEEAQEPCNFQSEIEEEEVEDEFDEEEDDYQVNPLLSPRNRRAEVSSVRSSLSYITIDNSIYQDILANRQRHDIFNSLDADSPDEVLWFYKPSAEEGSQTEGPFTSRQMDELFQQDRLGEDHYLRKEEDEDFIPFAVVLKRYYKKLAMEKQNAQPRKSNDLTVKLSFLNPEAVTFSKRAHQKRHSAILTGQRMNRVLSHEVKPNLSFLDEIVEDADMNEFIQTRCRSNTMQR